MTHLATIQLRLGDTLGQVLGCQSNLEVGDPLSGTDAPPIVMPNHFTYHLQELAFFSWFMAHLPWGFMAGTPTTAPSGRMPACSANNPVSVGLGYRNAGIR
jgi:hypothetical protein